MKTSWLLILWMMSILATFCGDANCEEHNSFNLPKSADSIPSLRERGPAGLEVALAVYDELGK
jgi:hypothetical protein